MSAVIFDNKEALFKGIELMREEKKVKYIEYKIQRPEKYRPIRYRDNLPFIKQFDSRLVNEYLLLINSELICQNDAINKDLDKEEFMQVPTEVKLNRYRLLYTLANVHNPKRNIVSDRVSFNSRLN